MTGEVIERPLGTIILAAGTAGGTSSTFRVGTQPVCLSILGDTLGAGETATVEFQDVGETWKVYVHALLGAMVIDGTNNETAITIYDTGIYRAVLTATANDCGLQVTGRDYC